MTARIQIFPTVEWAGPIEHDFNMLYIPQKLAVKAGFVADKPYLLKIGSLAGQVFVKIVPSGASNKIWCSQSLFNVCSLPAGTTLTLKAPDKDTIKLGPVIGLLAVKFGEEDNPFGKQAKFLRALCDRANKAGCFVYVFSPEDLIANKGLVHGYLPAAPEAGYPEIPELSDQFDELLDEPENQYDQGDAPVRWTRAVLPIPDLVYNRIPSRFWENQELFSSTLDLLKKHIPVFNPGFLDKCEVQQGLCQLPEVAGYLPNTITYEKPADIAEFMVTYRDVFLKPCSGSLGRRIIRVKKIDGSFNYKYRKSNGDIAEGNCHTADELVHTLRFVMGQQRRYMIQQAIPLALFEGQEFDVRLLMQKDRYGRWRRTKTYVRLVQPGSFTANISTGAAARSIVEVVKSVFAEDFQAAGGIGDKIRTGAEEIALAVEKAFPGTWAEMGIDFGIDIKGRVWLIEVNSKPFRALVSPSGVSQRIERSFIRPLEYAKYLLGFFPHSIY